MLLTHDVYTYLAAFDIDIKIFQSTHMLFMILKYDFLNHSRFYKRPEMIAVRAMIHTYICMYVQCSKSGKSHLKHIKLRPHKRVVAGLKK